MRAPFCSGPAHKQGTGHTILFNQVFSPGRTSAPLSANNYLLRQVRFSNLSSQKKSYKCYDRSDMQNFNPRCEYALSVRLVKTIVQLADKNGIEFKGRAFSHPATLQRVYYSGDLFNNNNWF